MQTTCPECRTTFRVSQDHLGARRGLVRCGTCNAVFNAYDTLLPELETPPDASSSDSDRNVAAPSLLEADRHPAQGLGEKGEDAAACLIEPEPQAEPPGMSAQSDAAESSDKDLTYDAPLHVPDVSALPDSKAAPDILLEPMWPNAPKPARTWKFWLQLVLAILLACLLVLQSAYFLRAELAAVLPASRQVLETLCRPLDCSVPLPRQLTQAAIQASSLEHDPENKSRVRLTLLLVNRTEQTQAWPHILLTLSDVRQAPVAQQVFRPQTYLPKDVKIAAGMAADVEREIRLDLDIGNLVASGYALSLTYP